MGNTTLTIRDCGRSLPDHGRQISESESETIGAEKGESRQRGSEEEHGRSCKSGAQAKEVEARGTAQPTVVR
jgi:hypothetical protein